MVEALLQTIHQGFEEYRVILRTMSIVVFQVLWIILKHFFHPVLFRFYCLCVGIAVTRQDFVNHYGCYQLWEVWDSRRCSEEKLQGVFNCRTITVYTLENK